MKIILEVKKGPQVGRTFEFTEPDTFMIGRTRQAHFKLSSDDLYVSRRHFLIEIAPPNCYLRDLGSKNGTKVNGKKIKQTRIRHGDIIEVGKTVLRASILISREIEKTACSLCNKIIPPNVTIKTDRDDIICPSCERMLKAEKKLRQKQSMDKFPAKCRTCGYDLSVIANNDGRAKELKDIVSYLCGKCTDKFSNTSLTGKIDDYKILGLLGKGGIGEVYSAVHEPTGRLIALKKVAFHKISLSDKAKKRFQREMRIMERLSHPNIVTLLDQGIFQGENYLVSEFMDGGDASQLVTEKFKGPVPPDVSCKVLLDILNGLDYFHKSGNAHRDIKPQNMLLRDSNNELFKTAKIADFGLAKGYADAGGSTITEYGEYGGTLLFMAPEQIINFKHILPSVDVYSAGMSLYYLLSARFPFDFPSQIEVMKANIEKRKLKDPILIVLEERPIPIRDKFSAVPKPLAEIVDRSIQKEMDRRFSSAAELREEIERVMKRI